MSALPPDDASPSTHESGSLSVSAGLEDAARNAAVSGCLFSVKAFPPPIFRDYDSYFDHNMSPEKLSISNDNTICSGGSSVAPPFKESVDSYRDSFEHFKSIISKCEAVSEVREILGCHVADQIVELSLIQLSTFLQDAQLEDRENCLSFIYPAVMISRRATLISIGTRKALSLAATKTTAIQQFSNLY
jgi:hypothetical protein